MYEVFYFYKGLWYDDYKCFFFSSGGNVQINPWKKERLLQGLTRSSTILLHFVLINVWFWLAVQHPKTFLYAHLETVRIMWLWPSLLKIQYTELKLSCRNDPVVKNSIYRNCDLDLWPNDPKINRVLPLQQGIHVAKFGKDLIYRTKVIVRKPV
jgi:hypothetical protein